MQLFYLIYYEANLYDSLLTCLPCPVSAQYSCRISVQPQSDSILHLLSTRSLSIHLSACLRTQSAPAGLLSLSQSPHSFQSSLQLPYVPTLLLISVYSTLHFLDQVPSTASITLYTDLSPQKHIVLVTRVMDNLRVGEPPGKRARHTTFTLTFSSLGSVQCILNEINISFSITLWQESDGRDSISNKCYSFELCFHQIIILKKCITVFIKILSRFKTVLTLIIIIINVSWGQSQHIRTISVGSCNNKDCFWKLLVNIYCGQKLRFRSFIFFFIPSF